MSAKIVRKFSRSKISWLRSNSRFRSKEVVKTVSVKRFSKWKSRSKIYNWVELAKIPRKSCKLSAKLFKCNKNSGLKAVVKAQIPRKSTCSKKSWLILKIRFRFKAVVKILWARKLYKWKRRLKHFRTKESVEIPKKSSKLKTKLSQYNKNSGPKVVVRAQIPRKLPWFRTSWLKSKSRFRSKAVVKIPWAKKLLKWKHKFVHSRARELVEIPKRSNRLRTKSFLYNKNSGLKAAVKARILRKSPWFRKSWRSSRSRFRSKAMAKILWLKKLLKWKLRSKHSRAKELEAMPRRLFKWSLRSKTLDQRCSRWWAHPSHSIKKLSVSSLIPTSSILR